MNDRPDLLDRLGEALGRILHMSIRQRTPAFDPEAAYDRSRGQYNSTVMLRLLLGDPGITGDRLLGVTSVDLCTPVLTYVFGEAQLDGRGSVVSVHRLRTEVYGLPPDDALLYERLQKEAVHELGHTFGLVHCADPGCVMHASTYAEEIDFKGPGLCPRCLGVVRAAINQSRAAT
ncbi:MAG: hypothetical protein A2W00_08530 [Candidatus Eisenbacteria bacterium RBG_16_71_46]|nr:MAG: hypothetical protein A2W00_08530 [Candidatus Eisenbacteria bacterium RBG_16_71_46]OGF21892.1 MAG: hypothetical protein A2V63_04905 [Candidatus Eisenbacteria bacterium RBG_19FT_COMBO_70_11]